jgi:hypothetical protein
MSSSKNTSPSDLLKILSHKQKLKQISNLESLPIMSSRSKDFYLISTDKICASDRKLSKDNKCIKKISPKKSSKNKK